MQIGIKDMRPGDNLIFKRAKKDRLAFILSLAIRLFYPKWDMWGWHMAFVAYWDDVILDWIIGEATWPKVRTRPLSEFRVEGAEFRVYRWFEQEPDRGKIMAFLSQYQDCRYDVLLYFWTAAAYLIRHFWNRPIPRLLDRNYTCWEYVCEFDEGMGKEIISKYDCPILADIQQELEKKDK
jgi:hypothetical protein